MDADGKTCFLLQEQYRGYKNEDKTKNKQKALPASVLRKMHDVSLTPWDFAVTHLLVLALFFAMRSCEYLVTKYPEESKRTKILRLRNIVFKKNGRYIPHSVPLEVLLTADLVIITFEFQKNEQRDYKVHMFRTTDALLCPVKAAARTVKRVRNIPGSSDESKICSFFTENGKVSDINSAQVLPRLRAIVRIIGEDILGFKDTDIGLHSLRSGGAMAMFLSGVSTIVIKRIGRWMSDAFLEYIREQVESFTFGVAQRMLDFEHFHTINANASIIPDFEEHNEDGPFEITHNVHITEFALGEGSQSTVVSVC